MKQLRLAKVCTLEAANTFLEKEYWPEWNECFARPVKDFPDQHRPLSEAQDLAAILCHAEGSSHRQRLHIFFRRAAASDFSVSKIQAGMRRQSLRGGKLRLNGELKARYQGHYLAIGGV